MIHFNYTGTEEDNIQLRRMFNEYLERGIHVTRLRPREMPQPWIDKIEEHLGSENLFVIETIEYSDFDVTNQTCCQ